VLLIFFVLSLACRNGGCGLREMDSGLSQSVNDSSTVALLSLGCIL